MIAWAVFLIIVVIGVLNLFLVHPIPAMGYLLLSLIYFPPANGFLHRRLGFSISVAVKVILFVIIMMFTLGVSDLGDMIDKL